MSWLAMHRHTRPRGVQGLKIVERLPLNVDIHRLVHQLYGILYQSLVFRMTHAGRIHCAVIELGERGELLVDDRLVFVAAGHRRLQVVRDKGHRHPAEKVKRILAGPDQIFLLLGPYRLAIRKLAAWQNRDEHFHVADLTCHGICDLESVSGEVDIHLIACQMLYMPDNLLLEPVTAE